MPPSDKRWSKAECKLKNIIFLLSLHAARERVRDRWVNTSCSVRFYAPTENLFAFPFHGLTCKHYKEPNTPTLDSRSLHAISNELRKNTSSIYPKSWKNCWGRERNIIYYLCLLKKVQQIRYLSAKSSCPPIQWLLGVPKMTLKDPPCWYHMSSISDVSSLSESHVQNSSTSLHHNQSSSMMSLDTVFIGHFALES